MSPILINGINMSISGVFAMAISTFIGETVNIAAPMEFIGWMTIIIIITNFICYNLYGVLLKKFSSTLISFASLTMPFFAAITGWLYHREVVSWHNFAATIITFLGLYIFYRAEKKKKSIIQLLT